MGGFTCHVNEETTVIDTSRVDFVLSLFSDQIIRHLICEVMVSVLQGLLCMCGLVVCRAVWVVFAFVAMVLTP